MMMCRGASAPHPSFGWSRLRLAWRARGQSRQAQGQAEREAADLIERARRGAERDGKVVRPGRFGDKRKDLH